MPLVAVLTFHWPSRHPLRTLSWIPGGNRVYLPTYVQRWESWVTSRGIEKDKKAKSRERENVCISVYVADTMSSLKDARGCKRDKVVKGEFYSRWGSELLPSALALPPSFYFSLLFSSITRLFSSYVSRRFAKRIPRQFKAPSDALCCNGSNRDRLYPPAGSPPPAAPYPPRPGCRESAHRERYGVVNVIYWLLKRGLHWFICLALWYHSVTVVVDLHRSVWRSWNNTTDHSL